jgi:hypothetical protein
MRYVSDITVGGLQLSSLRMTAQIAATTEDRVFIAHRWVPIVD